MNIRTGSHGYWYAATSVILVNVASMTKRTGTLLGGHRHRDATT